MLFRKAAASCCDFHLALCGKGKISHLCVLTVLIATPCSCINIFFICLKLKLSSNRMWLRILVSHKDRKLLNAMSHSCAMLTSAWHGMDLNDCLNGPPYSTPASTEWTALDQVWCLSGGRVDVERSKQEVMTKSIYLLYSPFYKNIFLSSTLKMNNFTCTVPLSSKMKELMTS